jgi:hypothetical protein
MPKVGPIEGCRIAIVAVLPMWLNAWPRPTVVVVLPSPSGVGRDGADDDVLARGLLDSSSIASSLILATPAPYGSSRWLPDADGAGHLVQRLQRRAAGDLQV